MKDPKKAEKFRKLAESMPAKIEQLRRPMTQNSTPKRQREYASRVIDGDNLERGRLALLALADAWDHGNVPEALIPLAKKDDIVRLVSHGWDSNGYYHVCSTHKYADTTEAGKALQAILEASMGRETKEQQEATKKKRELEAMIDKIRFCDIPGFFPTPAPIVDLVLEAADIHNGQTVLEPSAGIGSIADAIAAKFRIDSEPKDDCIRLTCIEINYTLSEILAKKGRDVIRTDFLQTSPAPSWDRVVMNPPFERGQDAEHIRHAYSVLKPGGRLVSIFSPGLLFREDKKASEFREWLADKQNEVTDLPDGSFNGAAAFRSTGVASKMIVIDKPNQET